MRLSGWGIAAGMLAAFMPFFTLPPLMFPDTNGKFFLILVGATTLISVFAYFLAQGKRSMSLRGRWLLGALGLAVLVQYVAAVMGVSPGRSFSSDIFWSSGVFFLTYLGALAVILSEVLSERDWSFVRRTVVISTALFSTITIIGKAGFGATGNLLWFSLADTNLSIGNETYAGMYLLLAFLFGTIEYVRTTRASVWKRYILGALALIGLSPLLINIQLFIGKVPFAELFAHPEVLLGDARSSSAAFLVLLLVLGVRTLLRRLLPKVEVKGLIVFSLTLIVGAVAGIGLLFTPGSVVQEAYIQQSTAARVIVWNMGLEAGSERAVLGWGPENFAIAVEKYADSRLFLEENLAEIWFDRAHNVFIDVFVSTGVVGITVNALLIVAFLVVVIRAQKRKQIGVSETVVLLSFIPIHLLELQTGFDTVSTYFLLALMFGYVLSLEREGETKHPLSRYTTKIVGAALLVLVILGGKFVLLDEYNRQSALARTFDARGAADQKVAIEQSLTRVSSFESLRFSSLSFIKGSYVSLGSGGGADPEVLLSFADTYDERFKQYLRENPTHYRARMNYVYLMLLQTVLGRDRTDEAKQFLADSYELSPTNPITYVLDSVTELYRGNLQEAHRLMDTAVLLAPEARFTQATSAFLDQQIKSYPNLSPLLLENL